VKKRAVFLDRDGVINRAIVKDGKPFAPVSLDQFEILPGVHQALLNTRNAGFLNVVVTNQPDIATGKQNREVLNAMHAILRKQLAIDAIQVCPHTDHDHCECRKPKPGMLLAASREMNIELSASYLVGDRWRDIVAGQKVDCKCYFIDYGYDENLPNKPYVAIKSLLEFSERFLSAQP
jgi:D-glycero-D-manno-heptose 1,7-bisphosphate phosphatase